MTIYAILEALVGIAVGIWLAVATKKSADVVYGKLDNVGRMTNVLLTILYAWLTPVCVVLGIISYPKREGFLGVLGWIIAIIIASAPMVCGVSIGASVVLRRKGKSRLSFIVQFAGVLAILIAFAGYAIFVGKLLVSLN